MLGERRHQMVAACEAVDGLGGELWRAGSAELERVMGEADRMVAAGEAARVAVLAEVISRGGTGSGAEALSPVQWVRRARAGHPGGWGGAGGGGGAGVRGAWEGGGQGCRAVRGAAGAQRRCGAVRGRQAAAVHHRGSSPDGVGRVDPDRRGSGAAGVPPVASGAAGEVRHRRSAAARAGRREAVRVAVAAARGRDGCGGVPADFGPGGQGGARGGVGAVVGAEACGGGA